MKMLSVFRAPSAREPHLHGLDYGPGARSPGRVAPDGSTLFSIQGILQDWPGSSAGRWWFVT
ncbi:MAG TPA: hypothetical protein VN038_06630, partial [Dyadobacter sp.]|nr:hypothetical protein [Dyadobacter sp.]